MKKKILVVDDDSGILEAVSLILEEEYEVKIITKGEETYKLVNQFKPNLILLDVLMSGSDGREICKNLKKDFKTGKIPIVMMSAHPSAQGQAINFGANDFLAKPFETKDLLKAIKDHLS